MSIKSAENQARLLPTYRWDEWDERKGQKVSTDEPKLFASTQKRLLEFLRENAAEAGSEPRPPEDIINSIISMNVAKRSLATRRAEALIEKGEVLPPPISLIPTFMASGHVVLGVEDEYMKHDHPSQEVFAYNRLGKNSWLNLRFGEHCLTAMALAHPNGVVEPSAIPTRVKAHATVSRPSEEGAVANDWIIVSSKKPIATITENGRRASLISRVTGAVDTGSSLLKPHESDAIRNLSEHEVISNHVTAAAIGQKALLLHALERLEGLPDNPFYPVIQTVYLTQLDQK